MVDYVEPVLPVPTDPASSHVDSTTVAPEIRVNAPAPVMTPEVTSAATESLGVIIPSPTGRRVAYAIYAGASLLVTNIAVAFSAINSSIPPWLTIAIAVIGNLAAPFGALAIANASKK